MKKPVVGAQLYSLRDFLKTAHDAAACLKKVSDIGYTSVQLSGIGPIDPKDLVKMLKDCGLDVGATHVPWDRMLKDLDGLIAEHKLYGCRHMAIGGLWKGYEGLEGIRKFAAELAPMVPKLEAAGMTFSYHNHDHEFVKINGKTWLQWLYEMIDARTLKAELDTHWVQAGGGDPAEWIRRMKGRMPILHLKDMVVVRVEDKKEHRFAEIGEGNLNWPAILKAAEEVGVEYMMVEQDNCYGADPFACMATSYRNLKSWGYQ